LTGEHTGPDERTRTAIAWLLASGEPAIAWLARRDVLHEAGDGGEDILEGDKVGALLAGQQPDGGFGVHPYKKWVGAHWRLVSLVELGIPEGDPRAVAAAETVLDWLTSDEHRSQIRSIGGLTRRCASQEGNALAVAARLGLAEDPRTQLLAESLIEWQWPDGGWNCDLDAGGRRSSFHESLSPAWGLHEYAVATGDAVAASAARRTADLFLDHRLFRALDTGEVIHPSWLVLHYPPYWHYDILQAMLVLSRMGLAGDPRCEEAFEVLERRRLPDGRWRPGGYWWFAPGTSSGRADVVDWGRSAPNEMITLNALRVLESAGRL
jgi:hypothetical protein